MAGRPRSRRLSAGSCVLPSEVISAERHAGSTDVAHWREAIRPCRRRGAPRRLAAALLTARHAIDAVADKAPRFRETGAVAVDMESSAVAQVAAAHGLPFMAVRVIVDTAARCAAARGGGGEPRGQVQHAAAARRRSPRRRWRSCALMRLARRYRAAMRSLRAVAAWAARCSAVAGAPTARLA